MTNIWQNPKSIKPNHLRKSLTKQLTNKYKLKWLSEMEKRAHVEYTEHLKQNSN